MFKRIFVGYLAVLLISFAVLTLAFSFTVRQYLINDTVESLNRVAETLTTGTIQPGMHGGGHMRGVFFSLANRIAYADYVLLRRDGLIIESSDIEAYPPGIKNINETFMDLAFGEGNKQSLVERNLVAVHYPVITAGQRQEKALILYSRLDLLTQVNRSLLGILALALGAGIAVSLIAGALATRVIVEPLQQLKSRAGELAHRQFSGKLAIKTGDEVEELADTFNEMAEQLAEYDRVQKEFFQKASHELKTPLMSVQGYAEAIRDGIIPADEAENSLDIIIKESGRMKNLVDEFIYLSKMETIREKYTFERLSLQDAAREAVHAVQSLALSRDISLETKFSAVDTFIKGDPEKIHRLMLNILSNALRHARDKVTVIVEGSEISIEDDGPGFNPDQREKIFDPFYRGDNGGSGLGLAISRAIVEKHGGTIRANNRTMGGGEIRISFTN
jgi:signal transduction histidine kinase